MVLSDSLTFYLISSASSILVVILGVVYKSKCRVITCCGCMRVERDVDAEERIDEMELGKSRYKKGSEKSFVINDTREEISSQPQILFQLQQPTQTQSPRQQCIHSSTLDDV